MAYAEVISPFYAHGKVFFLIIGCGGGGRHEGMFLITSVAIMHFKYF